ncbi:hypothetical protein V6N13_024822 [Hibiscus sabdariffa]
MVTEHEAWKWDVFQHVLPHDILLRIATVMPPSTNSKPHEPCWGCYVDEGFLVSKAYNIRSSLGSSFAVSDLVWSPIAKYKGRQRIRNSMILDVDNVLQELLLDKSRREVDEAMCAYQSSRLLDCSKLNSKRGHHLTIVQRIMDLAKHL